MDNPIDINMLTLEVC